MIDLKRSRFSLPRSVPRRGSQSSLAEPCAQASLSSGSAFISLIPSEVGVDGDAVRPRQSDQRCSRLLRNAEGHRRRRRDRDENGNSNGRGLPHRLEAAERLMITAKPALGSMRRLAIAPISLSRRYGEPTSSRVKRISAVGVAHTAASTAPVSFFANCRAGSASIARSRHRQR
jgi:hypothetical protein